MTFPREMMGICPILAGGAAAAWELLSSRRCRSSPESFRGHQKSRHHSVCVRCSAAPHPAQRAESNSPGVGLLIPVQCSATTCACVVPMTLIVVLGFCLIERKARQAKSSLGFYLNGARSRSAGKSLARPLDLCLHRSSHLYLLLYIWPQSSKSLRHANNFKHGSSPYEPEHRSHTEYTHGAVSLAPLSAFAFPHTPHRTGLCTAGSSPTSLPPSPPSFPHKPQLQRYRSLRAHRSPPMGLHGTAPHWDFKKNLFIFLLIQRKTRNDWARRGQAGVCRGSLLYEAAPVSRTQALRGVRGRD